MSTNFRRPVPKLEYRPPRPRRSKPNRTTDRAEFLRDYWLLFPLEKVAVQWKNRDVSDEQ